MFGGGSKGRVPEAVYLYVVHGAGRQRGLHVKKEKIQEVGPKRENEGGFSLWNMIEGIGPIDPGTELNRGGTG